MSKKSIEKNLTKALLNDGKLEKTLFDYELAEHVVGFGEVFADFIHDSGIDCRS